MREQKGAATRGRGSSKGTIRPQRQGPRWAAFWAVLVALAMISGPAAALAATPTEAINQFHTALVEALKSTNGKGFEARRTALKPVISQSYDSGFMAKVASGSTWDGLSDAQRAQLTKAFQEMTVANYASRFKAYTGQTFEVQGTEPAPNSRTLVRTQLKRAKGDPVKIDYVMANGPKIGAWSIIDVRLNGAVSELALRRSEFSPVLRDKGFDALLGLLKEKTAAMASAPSDVEPGPGSP